MKLRDEEISVDYIRVAFKDRLSSSMKDELMDNQEDYRSLNHKYWCDLLSTIEVKDIRKRAATQIKKIASSRAAYHYDSYRSVRILRKKKSRNGVILSNKGPNNKVHKHHSTYRHCVICKKVRNA